MLKPIGLKIIFLILIDSPYRKHDDDADQIRKRFDYRREFGTWT